MPRAKHKYHYIYKTTCLVNRKYYVGMHSTSDLEDGYLGSGRRIWLSILKHGKENHTREILEMLEDRSSLKERERELVNEEMLQDPMCMNLMIGGDGGFISVEQQAKRSSAGGLAAKSKLAELHKDPIWKKNRVEAISKAVKLAVLEGRLKTDTFTGKSHSTKTLIQMQKSHKGKHIGSKNSQYGTCWIHNEKQSKKIKRIELSDFLMVGWIEGRKLNFQDGITHFQ